MKLVYCGTPSFAVPTLEALLAASHEIPLVLSQPDRPVGRSQQLTAPPVKQTALAAGLAVVQPEKIRNNAELQAQLEAIEPDAIVVVAYGRILPLWMLALPKHGCINLHASLLPKYRGAAPIQWAVAMGDAYTGNTTMLLEEGLDTGPILLQQTIEIAPNQTAAEMFDVLAHAGAPLVVETLAGLANGTVQPKPQSGEGVTFAPMLDREDGRMDFAGRAAHDLYNRWRGFQPWPGAFTVLDGKKFIVHRMALANALTIAAPSGAQPGHIHLHDHRVFAACAGETWIELIDVQLEGKKRMSASDFPARDAARPDRAAWLMKMGAVTPARKAAFQILMAVERGQSHSDDLLRSRHVNALSAADRNLATTLVLGVLRWQIRLDEQIKSLLKKPGARIDTEVLVALRMGAFQLLYLDRIPARAAIDESVELAKQAGHRFASGMVNAVLRKLGDAPRVEHDEKTAADVALSQAHPLWMVERWADTYGLQYASAICRHAQAQPDLTVRFTAPEVEAELQAAGVQLKPAEFLAIARTVVAGDVTAAAAFLEGRVRIQDEGSQLVAEIAAFAVVDRSRAAKILDACAAPGGKTLILIERNPQAHIVACEASEPRLAQLQKRLTNVSDRVECRLGDATKLDDAAGFDLVLADVPCSGTGTLGRNPEIRHRLRAEELPRQAERQRAILASALHAVRPGGRVVYATCSLEPEENEHVVASVLGENTKSRQLSLLSTLEGMTESGILTTDGAERLREHVSPEGALRLLPGVFDTDGFYIALLESKD